MNNKILDFKQYINFDNKGKFIVLKVNSRRTLESMKDGNFWFRHPAYFNFAENRNGDSDMGDKYDNKIESITTNKQFIPENTIRFNGLLSGKNLECEMKVSYVLYNPNQDENRQISFYRLDINEKEGYDSVNEKMASFGDSFSLVNVKVIINCLNVMGYSVTARECFYYEDNFSGECDAFFKRAKYSYQNEFRINLSSEKFKAYVENSDRLQKECKKNKVYVESLGNTDLGNEERILASINLEESERKIEEIKSEFYEVLTVKKNSISEIFPIELLLSKSNINQWKNV